MPTMSSTHNHEPSANAPQFIVLGTNFARTAHGAQQAESRSGAGSTATVWRIAYDGLRFREGEIRRALRPVAGIRSLCSSSERASLSRLTLQPSCTESTRCNSACVDLTKLVKEQHDDRHTCPLPRGWSDHSGHSHDAPSSGGWSDVSRYVVALVFAIAAEALSFFAPDALPCGSGGAWHWR